MTRPRIAIPSCIMYPDPNRTIFKERTLQYTEELMAAAIWRAGGLPTGIFDLQSQLHLEASLAKIDGIVLQGGADLSPSSYGQSPLRDEWAGDSRRDKFERELVNLSVEKQIPVLGICRGHQLINVACGGTLFQDIAEQCKDSIEHRDWNDYDGAQHSVTIVPNSWLAEIYSQPQILVNSVHHQAIDRLGDGLHPTAWSEDGIVEALELIDNRKWLVSVQWHPEWMNSLIPAAHQRASGDTLFAKYLDVCYARRQS